MWLIILSVIVQCESQMPFQRQFPQFQFRSPPFQPIGYSPQNFQQQQQPYISSSQDDMVKNPTKGSSTNGFPFGTYNSETRNEAELSDVPTHTSHHQGSNIVLNTNGNFEANSPGFGNDFVINNNPIKDSPLLSDLTGISSPLVPTHGFVSATSRDPVEPSVFSRPNDKSETSTSNLNNLENHYSSNLDMPQIMSTEPKMESVKDQRVPEVNIATSFSAQDPLNFQPPITPFRPPLPSFPMPSCGGSSSGLTASFRNPGYPLPSPQESCSFSLLLQPSVCQVRVEVESLSLAPPAQGLCPPSSQLIINTSTPFSHVPLPSMCGYLDSPTHLYLHTPEVSKAVPSLARPNSAPRSVSLTVLKGGVWSLALQQLPCTAATSQAPPGCSQYFTQPQANIKSFNFREGSYLLGQSFTTCIRPVRGACAIAYHVHYLRLDRSRQGVGSIGYGLGCNDYLVFEGQKTGFCGEIKDQEFIFRTGGKEGFTLRSDNHFNGKDEVGYDISYKFIMDCENLKYYKFPSSPTQKS